MRGTGVVVLRLAQSVFQSYYPSSEAFYLHGNRIRQVNLIEILSSALAVFLDYGPRYADDRTSRRHFLEHNGACPYLDIIADFERAKYLGA